jgi:DNA/RNA-binding protein KIN17
VVKILDKKLGDKFYKKKGVVEELHDQYTASVRLLDSKDKTKIDQKNLETVIPAIGEGVISCCRGNELSLYAFLTRYL